MNFNPDFNRAVVIVGDLKKTSHPTNKEAVIIYTFKLQRCNMEEFAANGQILAALEKNISTRPCMDFSTMKNPEVNIETKEFVINNKIAGTNGTHLNVNFLNCIEDKDSSCSKFLEKQ